MHKKTYINYFNKIVDFAKLTNISIYIGDTDELVFENKTITISNGQDYENELCSLLHEIGHFINYIHNDKLYKKRCLYNTLILSNHNLTRKEKAELLRMELRAWHYAKTISQLLKIKLPNFDLIKKQNITTYKILQTVTKRKKNE